MNTLFVTVGISGSGKSVFSSKLASILNIPRISSDEIRGEICGGDQTNQSKNGLVFKYLHERVEHALKNGHVIADATNKSVKERKPYREIAFRCGAKTVALVMTTSFEECVQQNNQRDRVVPEDVIQRQFNSLVPPGLNEVNEIWYIDWHTNVIQVQTPNSIAFVNKTLEELANEYKTT